LTVTSRREQKHVIFRKLEKGLTDFHWKMSSNWLDLQNEYWNMYIYIYIYSWFKSLILIGKCLDLNHDLNHWFKSAWLNSDNPVKHSEYPTNHSRNSWISWIFLSDSCKPLHLRNADWKTRSSSCPETL
jgi:hypothetical protein